MTRDPVQASRKFDSSEPTILRLTIPSAAAITEEMIEGVRVKIAASKGDGTALRMDTIPEADWELVADDKIEIKWRDQADDADPLPVGTYHMEALIDHMGADSPRRGPTIILRVTESLAPPPSP
jgi:hypothetical protein